MCDCAECPFGDREGLKQSILKTNGPNLHIHPSIACDQWQAWLLACVQAQGRPFEYSCTLLVVCTSDCACPSMCALVHTVRMSKSVNDQLYSVQCLQFKLQVSANVLEQQRTATFHYVLLHGARVF